jgi:hypothetical protein
VERTSTVAIPGTVLNRPGLAAIIVVLEDVVIVVLSSA